MIDWIQIHKPTSISTNDDAINYSLDANGQKFVIFADAQTNGRGRRGRSWIGLKGNLFASLGVSMPLSACGALTFITSLALVQSILSLSPHQQVSIKWPNDVLIKGQKLSGILIEKGKGDYLIVGVGVNIKEIPNSSEVMYPTTSLYQEGVIIDKEDFLDLFLHKFDFLIQEFMQNGFAPIREKWLKYAKGLGDEIRIMQEQTEKRGVFSGVDENGLLLLTRNGKIEKISTGDVFLR